MPTKNPQHNITFPSPGIYEQVKADAAANGMSLSGWLLSRAGYPISERGANFKRNNPRKSLPFGYCAPCEIGYSRSTPAVKLVRGTPICVECLAEQRPSRKKKI